MKSSCDDDGDGDDDDDDDDGNNTKYLFLNSYQVLAIKKSMTNMCNLPR